MLVLSQWLTVNLCWLTPSIPAHVNLIKLAYPLHMFIYSLTFSVWSWRWGNPSPGHPSFHKDCRDSPVLSPASPMKAAGHNAGTAGLFNKRRSQKGVPVVHLWPDVVQQARTNPTLRNGPSVVSTCSFDHKIISHNINSHTLLASYCRAPCIIHHASSTHSLSKKVLLQQQ